MSHFLTCAKISRVTLLYPKERLKKIVNHLVKFVSTVLLVKRTYTSEYICFIKELFSLLL